MEGALFAATKLEVPAARPGLVARDELLSRFFDAAARLTLVSAPAGSGKTTLIGQWARAASEPRRFAWLSLDAEDDDPVRFWHGVIAALARDRPGLGRAAGDALRVRGVPLRTAVLPLLINDLIECGDPTVLVLDDLHVVEDPEIHGTLAQLIERAPTMLHVAVTTRTDPPLPVPRLRARGELVEVHASDLRFSRTDAAAMLDGLGADAAAADELVAQTEGWAAGLQLAGLALRHRRPGWDDRRHGHIADYLGAEVLDAQSTETRDFLLRTSVLDRMSGELCDAVLRAHGSRYRLRELVEQNLFVVVLDPARRWFRYHHLFRELLERHLHEEAGPEEIVSLHRRASEWYERNAEPVEAIRHALAAGDGRRLVAEHWATFFNRGELGTVAGWLAGLPAADIDADPQLWLARAWLALDTGRLTALPAMLVAAEAGGTDDHRAWATLLGAVHAFKQGDLGTAAEHIERARGVRAAPLGFWRAVTAVIAGATAYWSADGAEPVLREALRTAEDDGNRLAELYARGYLSLTAGAAGHRDLARSYLETAESLIVADAGLGEHFVALTVHLARAAEDARRGEHETALAAADRALELARRGAGALEELAALQAIAQGRLRLGRLADAERALQEARAVLAGCPDPGPVAARLDLVDRPPQPDRDRLSDRELDVLRLLAMPLSQREIGAALYISMNTVKTHVKNIFFKLDVSSRDEAVDRGRRAGLL